MNTNKPTFQRPSATSGVAQVSKPAVSPVSKPAGRESLRRVRTWANHGLAQGTQASKPAIQQIWKSALLTLATRRSILAKPAGRESLRRVRTWANHGLAQGTQASKPAIQQIWKSALLTLATRRSILAKPAGRESLRRVRTWANHGLAQGTQASKPATQQIWKPALLTLATRRSILAKPAGRETSRRVRTWANHGLAQGTQASKPAIQQIWKSALRRWDTTMGAAPTPIFWTRAQTGGHRIISDIPNDARFLSIRPNPMIKGFTFPERFIARTNDHLGPARAELFPGFKNVRKQKAGHGPDHRMHMVGHDHPLMQQIALLVKVPHGTGHQFSDLRMPQMTSAHSLIQKTLHLTAKVPGNDFRGIARCRPGFVQLTQAIGLFLFKAQQHIPRQGIRQAKGDKIRSALALYVRQITAGMNAGPKRVDRLFDTVSPQLMAHAIQTWIGILRHNGLHGGNLAKLSRKGEHYAFGVAQVSKPAVSPVSKPAGRESSRRVRTWANHGFAQGTQASKPAIQQIWKSALLTLATRRSILAKPAGRETAGRVWTFPNAKSPFGVAPVSKPAGREVFTACPDVGKPRIRAGHAGLETCATHFGHAPLYS